MPRRNVAPMEEDDDQGQFVLLKPIPDSDDEQAEQEQPVVQVENKHAKRRRLSKLQPLALNEALFAEHRLQLRRVVSANCKCKARGLQEALGWKCQCEGV